MLCLTVASFNLRVVIWTQSIYFLILKNRKVYQKPKTRPVFISEKNLGKIASPVTSAQKHCFSKLKKKKIQFYYHHCTLQRCFRLWWRFYFSFSSYFQGKTLIFCVFGTLTLSELIFKTFLFFILLKYIYNHYLFNINRRLELYF